LGTDNGKDDQAQGVQHQEQAAQMRHDGGDNGRQHGCYGDNNHVFRMLYPAKRVVTQQDIAH